MIAVIECLPAADVERLQMSQSKPFLFCSNLFALCLGAATNALPYHGNGMFDINELFTGDTHGHAYSLPAKRAVSNLFWI